MLFRGRNLRSLDNKSRLILPPDFREILHSRSDDGKMVLTTYDGCVVGYPLPDWLSFEQAMHKLRNPSRQLRDFRRLVIGGAEEMCADGHGRIRLSRDHLAYAGIESELILMGQGQRFELWSPIRLDEVLHKNYDDVAESLADASDGGFDLIF